MGNAGLGKPAAIVLCCVVLLHASSVHAIVNMDDLHFGSKSPGVKGTLSFGMGGASGNSDNSRVSVDAIGEQRVGHYANVAIANYQYGESNDVRDTNSAFLHLRHIRDTSVVGRAFEGFAQMERNEFTRLKLRSLVGGGVRYSFKSSQGELQHIVGVGGFFSTEELDPKVGIVEDARQEVVRGNVYWLSRLNASSTARVYSTVYYQPAVDRIDDFRLLGVISLKVHIEENLDLKLSINAAHDNEPPLAVEQTDINYLTGLEYRF